MKRDEIKELLDGKLSEGVEIKEILDQIMKLNGDDINKAKGDTEELKETVKTLTGQLAQANKDLEALKEVDADKLQEEIDRLKGENDKAAKDYAAKVAEMQLSAAVKEALHAAEAKDVDLVIRNLDMSAVSLDKEGKLVGLDEQVTALKDNELTKAMFGGTSLPTGAKPAGAGAPPADKKPSDMTYTELAEFLANGGELN